MRRTAPLLAILLCAVSVGAVRADDHRDENRRAARGHQMERQDHRQSGEAADWARQQVPGGRILSVQPTDDGRRRVKVLKDGEVRVLTRPESDEDR